MSQYPLDILDVGFLPDVPLPSSRIGWVFEVSSSAEGPVAPVPLKDMGRFRHEAVAVDPRSGMVYETEDNSFRPDRGQPGSGFYRFIPNDTRFYEAGGALQLLKVKGAENIELFRSGAVGLFQELGISWVDIPEPAVDPNDELSMSDRNHAVFDQGAEQGATGIFPDRASRGVGFV